MANTNLPTSFLESCEKLGLNPDTAKPDVSGLPAHIRDRVTAFSEMLINAEAINSKDWVPQKGELVWYVWVEWDYDTNGIPVGFRFSYASDGYVNAGAPGGAALFETREKAQHAGRTFIDTLKRMMPPNFNK